jgi:hypothetical protein
MRDCRVKDVMVMKPLVLGVLVAALGLASAVAAGSHSAPPAVHRPQPNPVVDDISPDTPHGTFPDGKG